MGKLLMFQPELELTLAMGLLSLPETFNLEITLDSDPELRREFLLQRCWVSLLECPVELMQEQ